MGFSVGGVFFNIVNLKKVEASSGKYSKTKHDKPISHTVKQANTTIALLDPFLKNPSSPVSYSPQQCSLNVLASRPTPYKNFNKSLAT